MKLPVVVFVLCFLFSPTLQQWVLPPTVSLTLQQSIPLRILPFNSKNDSQLVNSICASDIYLGVPSNFDDSVVVYQFDANNTPPYTQYGTLTTTLFSPLINANLVSCEFRPGNNEYDIIVGGGYSNTHGQAFIFPRQANYNPPYVSLSYSLTGNYTKPSEFMAERLWVVSTNKMILSARYTDGTGAFYVAHYSSASGSYTLSSPMINFFSTLGFVMYQNEIVYVGSSEVGQIKAYYIPENSTTITPMPQRDFNTSVTFTDSYYGDDGAFVDVDTVALFHGDFLTSGLSGSVEIWKYDGVWNMVSSYSPNPINASNGFDPDVSIYNFGQMLTSNGSLIYVTSQDNVIHVLFYDGNGTLTELTNYTSGVSLSTNNFAFCKQSEACTPAPMKITSNRLLVPGNASTSYFSVNIGCNSGYNLSVLNACNDIDECALGLDSCSYLRTCNNTAGSYFCDDCPTGYNDSGPYNCVDINECALGTDLCSTNPNRTCINTNGSYICGDCPTGYSNNGPYNCADIDECTAGTSNCSTNPLRVCSNTIGGYTCDDCPSGYQDYGPYLCISNNATTFSNYTASGTNSATGSATSSGTNNATGSATSSGTNNGTGTSAKTSVTSGVTGTGQQSGAIGMMIASLLFVIVVILI